MSELGTAHVKRVTGTEPVLSAGEVQRLRLPGSLVAIAEVATK